MPIHLGEVLFPLRYDVVVQAPVVKALSQLDVPGFLEAGRDTPIYHHIGLAEPVYQEMGLIKELSGRELHRRTQRHYRNRIKKLISQYHSINRGWDTRRGLLYYKQMVNPTVTTSGFPVPDGLFLGDGQHRTTVLLALGYVTLPDSIATTEVKDGNDYRPLDMTYGYVRAGHCTEQQFVDFARFRFPEVPVQLRGVQALADWTKDNGPEWAVEYIKLYWRTA